MKLWKDRRNDGCGTPQLNHYLKRQKLKMESVSVYVAFCSFPAVCNKPENTRSVALGILDARRPCRRGFLDSDLNGDIVETLSPDMNQRRKNKVAQNRWVTAFQSQFGFGFRSDSGFETFNDNRPHWVCDLIRRDDSEWYSKNASSYLCALLILYHSGSKCLKLRRAIGK